MDTLIASQSSVLGPIEPDWTIAELIHWLSDDSRQHDAALRHPLSGIEAELTGAHWAGTPSTVALIRSLADAVRVDPALRSIRIRDLGSRETSRLPERLPQVA